MIKKIYLVPLIAIVLILTWFGLQQKSETTIIIHHMTIADPKQYVNGTFSDIMTIQKGSYKFSFVPNGDSPQVLSITMSGKNFSHTQDFMLNGTLHDTGISKYYTWDYAGDKSITIPFDQQLQILINPHGNTLGSISVDIIKS